MRHGHLAIFQLVNRMEVEDDPCLVSFHFGNRPKKSLALAVGEVLQKHKVTFSDDAMALPIEMFIIQNTVSLKLFDQVQLIWLILSLCLKQKQKNLILACASTMFFWYGLTSACLSEGIGVVAEAKAVDLIFLVYRSDSSIFGLIWSMWSAWFLAIAFNL